VSCKQQMGDDEDPYLVLGVPRSATPDEVKAAYRKAARKNHPDRGGSPEAFQRVQRAYEALTAPPEDASQSPHGFSDLFSGLFGQGQRQRRPKQSVVKDLVVELEATLSQLYLGERVTVTVARTVLADPKVTPRECPVCHGEGVVLVTRRMAPGMVQQMTSTCEQCNGTGSTARFKRENARISVLLEQGMDEDARIRCPEEGHTGPRGERGDVVAVVRQIKHADLERRGRHLVMSKRVPLLHALCGVQFIWETLDARRLCVTTPRGTITRPGSMQVVSGEGMPVDGDPTTRGDLIIVFEVVFPRDGSLDEEQLKCLRDGLTDGNKEGVNDGMLEGAWSEGSVEVAETEPLDESILQQPGMTARRRKAYEGSRSGGAGSFFSFFKSAL